MRCAQVSSTCLGFVLGRDGLCPAAAALLAWGAAPSSRVPLLCTAPARWTAASACDKIVGGVWAVCVAWESEWFYLGTIWGITEKARGFVLCAEFIQPRVYLQILLDYVELLLFPFGRMVVVLLTDAVSFLFVFLPGQ